MANFIAIFIASFFVTASFVFVATLFGYEQEPITGPVFFTVMFLLYLISKAGERLEKREEKETKERQQKDR